MSYTSEENIENYLMTTIDSSFSSQIDTWIKSVEEYIDNYTERSFIADDSASARFYDGDNSRTISIDDCVEITKVEVGDDV